MEKEKEELQNSVYLMEATLESIKNGILVVDTDGTILKTNAMFAEMWHIPAHILASADDKNLLAYIHSQLTDPDVFNTKVSDIYTKVGADSFDFIYLVDGRIFERSSKPLVMGGELKGRVWSFLDITERKLAEVELFEAETNYHDLFNTIQQAIYIQNRDLTFVNVNQGAVVMYGYEREYFIGKTPEFLSAPGRNDLNRISELVALAFNGQPQKYQFWGLRKDGTVFPKDIWTAKGKYFGRDVVITIASDITERVQAEKALHESEAIYRNLVLRLPDGVYKSTHEGKFIDVNPAMVSILGYSSKEELMSIDIKTQLYFEPTDRESLILQEKLEETGVYRLKKKDGSGIWVEDKGWYNLDEKGNILSHEGILRDITEKRQAEQALIYEQYLLHTLMNNVPDHIYFKDLESRFIRINNSQAQLFGLSDPSQAIGKTDFDFFTHEHAQQAFDDEQEIIRTGQPVSKEEKETWADIPDTWVSTYKMPLIGKDNKIIGTFGISKNIDERKKAEAEIQSKNVELHRLNVEKDKFFSIIAHDLRSPFNGFLGLTEIMDKELPRLPMHEIQKIAVMLRKSATNLFSLLGNLLEWSSMQRGLTTFSPDFYLLKSKISESMVYVLEGARKKEVSVNYAIPRDLVVYADPNMLAGIIRNLVSNAVKFTPKGGSILISARSGNSNLVHISVKDSGIGMNKNMLDNLFCLDVNTKRSGTDGEYSTGLGLILCKDFIEKHGGKLWIDSEEGKGSTFHLTLPGKSSE